MELEQVEKFLSVQGKQTGYYADRMRATARCDNLELYWVTNTANSDQFVLASSPKYARIISASSGHIRDVKNGNVYRANDSFFEKNPGFGSAVKRAVRDRTPGIVERRGEHAVMKDKVYSPLTAV